RRADNSINTVCTLPTDVCDHYSWACCWSSCRAYPFHRLYSVYCALQFTGICSACTLVVASRRVSCSDGRVGLCRCHSGPYFCWLCSACRSPCLEKNEISH